MSHPSKPALRSIAPLPVMGSLQLALLLGACSSAPHAADEKMPSWTTGPTRTIEGGYLIYVGAGQDRAPEKASFKAESMALQDLANECSFAPKGTRVEDRYQAPSGIITQAFAKVAVELQDCEAAKRAISPEEIRTLASASFAEQIKKYQELVDTPEPEESLAEATAPPAGEPQVAALPAAARSWDTMHFFVVRQQVAIVKQEVILAPPQSYPQGAPQSTTPLLHLKSRGEAIQAYESAHPELQKSAPAFSAARPNSFAHRPEALREGSHEPGQPPRLSPNRHNRGIRPPAEPQPSARRKGRRRRVHHPS